MLFIIRLIWGHIQSDCTIARYQISIKLNYCEIEFSPRAQESLAVHPFTFCLLPSWDRWKSVCPGEQWHVHHQVWEPRHNASPPPLPSEDWAAVPIPGHSGFLLMRVLSQLTGSPSFVSEPRKVSWKAGTSTLLYLLYFTKARIGPELAYREFIFCPIMLLTERCKEKEDNPQLWSRWWERRGCTRQLIFHLCLLSLALIFTGVSCSR